MSFVGELKIAIFFARLMGVAPYKIVERRLQLSPIAVLYSIMLQFIYIYIPFWQTLSKAEFGRLTRIQTILVTVKIVLFYFGMSVSLISSLTCHRKLCAFVNRINKFDEMTNMRRDGITRKREAFLWAIVVVPMAIRLIMQVYYNYAIIGNWRNWQLNSTVHYLGLGIVIGQYTIMVSCVLRRFQHLNRLFIPGQANTVGLREFPRGRSRLHYAWILHADLVEASEELNSMFNYQSSLWFSSLAFTAITRLYPMWKRGTGLPPAELFIGIVSTIHNVLLMTGFLAVCHITATEANNVGATVFCSRLKILQNNVDWVKEVRKKCTVMTDSLSSYDILLSFLLFYRPQDIFSIGQYFVLRRFYFISTAGLIRIDLPVLQTIVGLITTYLVILKDHDNLSSTL